MIRGASMLIAVVLACGGRAGAQTHFVTEFHAAHGVHNHLMAGGRASLVLSADQKQLSYFIELDGLDLESVPANRIDPEDVFGIHMHLIVPGQIGPHILNIFGDPAEDDADLVVDFAQDALQGIFEISDASRDPATGELLPQFFPLTTKVIDDWIDDLMADGLYLAVHTVGQNGAALLHGDVIRVPEPGTAWLIGAGAAALGAASRFRNGGGIRHFT